MKEMIKEINLVGLMNNNLLLFIMMMCSVIFVSCTKLKNKQSFNVNLFDFNQLSYNELTDLGFKPSENTDFTSLYQYFGDTAKHEDTLVYYQFENNPKENSLPIYRHISVYMERQDYTFIGEYLDEENFEIISKIDTINDNYFFKIENRKNKKEFDCSVSWEKDIELYEFKLGYTFPPTGSSLSGSGYLD